MNNFKVLGITLVLSFALLYLHIQGMASHLYMNYWFYDIILHFLGGVCVSLALFCIAKLFKISFILNNLWLLILSTFVIGFGWELFELAYGISGHDFGTREYNIDTVKDLIMDTLGGSLALYFYKNK